MTEELLAKAKEAQSPEELLTLMSENGIEDFTKEDAEELYTEIHTTGELTDEELENVTGGKVTVGGQKYKMVNSGMSCFTGKWECGFNFDIDSAGFFFVHSYSDCKRTDHKSLRNTWQKFSDFQECGNCLHLGFTKALTGYCEVEHDS